MGFQRFFGFRPASQAAAGAVEPGERRLSASDPPESHVLPEIVHDTRTDRQALWLTVGIVVVVLAAGGGFFVGRATVPAQLPASAADSDYDDTSPPPAATGRSVTQSGTSVPAGEAAQPRRHYSHPGELQGAAVIAAAKPASGTMYVHRMNSDVRDQPSYDAQVIKKEAKGAQVQLIALSDKWAEIRDGAIKGWMRASVLKDTPPGEKRNKKDSDN